MMKTVVAFFLSILLILGTFSSAEESESILVEENQEAIAIEDLTVDVGETDTETIEAIEEETITLGTDADSPDESTSNDELNSESSANAYSNRASGYYSDAKAVIYSNSLCENYNGWSHATYKREISEYDKQFGRRLNVYGKVDNCLIGEMGAWFSNMNSNTGGVYSARKLLEALIQEERDVYGYTAGADNVLYSNSVVELIDSELYAWGICEFGTMITDEYYKFRIWNPNSRGGDAYCYIYHAYGEYDGGEGAEGQFAWYSDEYEYDDQFNPEDATTESFYDGSKTQTYCLFNKVPFIAEDFYAKKWSTSNKKVISIIQCSDYYVYLNMKKAGTAKITAIGVDGKKRTMKIHVKDESPATGMVVIDDRTSKHVNGKTISLHVGESVQLQSVAVRNKMACDADRQSNKWTVNDTSIISTNPISLGMIITGRKTGRTKIKVKSYNGKGTYVYVKVVK